MEGLIGIDFWWFYMFDHGIAAYFLDLHNVSCLYGQWIHVLPSCFLCSFQVLKEVPTQSLENCPARGGECPNIFVVRYVFQSDMLPQ